MYPTGNKENKRETQKERGGATAYPYPYPSSSSSPCSYLYSSLYIHFSPYLYFSLLYFYFDFSLFFTFLLFYFAFSHLISREEGRRGKGHIIKILFRCECEEKLKFMCFCILLSKNKQ